MAYLRRPTHGECDDDCWCHDSPAEGLHTKSGQAISEISSPQVLPKNFLRPCLLLLLREHPAHGYDLLERLRPLGFSREDPGRLYRALRALESDGLVRSVWEKSTSGPDRRMYELTRAGMEVLHDSAKALMATDEILGVFLSRYSEFVALEPEAGKRSRARRS